MNVRGFRAAIFAAGFLCLCGCDKGGGPRSGEAPGALAPTADRAGAIDRPIDEGSGSFRGRVIFDGPARGRQKLTVVKDVAVCAKVNHLDDRLVVGENGGIRYAVVTVKGVKDGKTLRTMGREFVLDQRACAYSPHVLLLPAGSPLSILNNDGILHNIHTFSTLNKPFNVAQPKVVRELKRTFEVPEKIAVRCDVHGWMCAWVIVVDHPYHAVTDEEGRFEIEGIPPGRYSVECWQEELGTLPAEITLTVADGRTGNASYDFVYPGDSLRTEAGGSGPGI